MRNFLGGGHPLPLPRDYSTEETGARFTQRYSFSRTFFFSSHGVGPSPFRPSSLFVDMCALSSADIREVPGLRVSLDEKEQAVGETVKDAEKDDAK